MRAALRLAAAAGAAALAACTDTAAPEPGANLSQPSAVAVFRGYTTKSSQLRPYVAIANSASNHLTIMDGTDDTLVEAPAPLRGLVYPVPGRPVLLASADLGDGKPDLLVAVTAGDLPWLGGSRLSVVRTWRPDGAVVGEVDLGAHILDVVALPFDPAGAPSQVKVAAALAGDRVAVVTFTRSTAGDGLAIDPAAATVETSALLGFQPVDLDATPGVPGFVWAATQDDLGGGVHGVARIDVTGMPAPAGVLDARAPTRLVTSLRLADAIPLTPALDATAFDGQAVEERVYAVLDESGCGLQAPIACGLVALDPGTGKLALDPTTATSFQAPFRAPIPVGYALALAATPPPAVPPSPADPQYAGTYLRMVTSIATRATTGAAAVASVDGTITFVDLGRWEVPSHQSVVANVKVERVISTRPPGTAGTQRLVLDPSTPVTVTAGYTPTDLWTVTSEGILPGLSSVGAEIGADGALALEGAGRIYDPTLGVQADDIVVIEPSGLGTCTTFEAAVLDLVPPSAARPGGAVRLKSRGPANAAWNRCLGDLLGPIPSSDVDPRSLRATFRAGGYVLVRGKDRAVVHAGRPKVGDSFSVAWQDEDALASACLLPPAVPWPALPALAPTCAPGAGGCRDKCEQLVRARLARRIGYLTEPSASITGPAIAFKLAIEGGTTVPRDAALVIETVEGRAPFRVSPTAGSPVDPRAVVPFDRSPWSAPGGVRFLVPYAGNAVVDTSPTQGGGGVNTIH